jgi:hypothetical protein
LMAYRSIQSSSESFLWVPIDGGGREHPETCLDPFCP